MSDLTSSRLIPSRLRKKVLSPFLSVLLLLLFAAGSSWSAPFDYVLKPTSSRIHLSLGLVSPTTIKYDQLKEDSRVALSGGFGFEIPVRLPLAWALDFDLHDLAVFESHTRFLVVSTGLKYALLSTDRRLTIKPVSTLGIGYISDRRMPVRDKTIMILRTGVDLNVATDSRTQWLLSGSILWFPSIRPDKPDVSFSPIFLVRFGIII